MPTTPPHTLPLVVQTVSTYGECEVERTFTLEEQGITIACIPVVAENAHRAKADADHLVHCVNTHAALVAACQIALDNLTPLYSSDHLVIQSLRNALAQERS